MRACVLVISERGKKKQEYFYINHTKKETKKRSKKMLYSMCNFINLMQNDYAQGFRFNRFEHQKYRVRNLSKQSTKKKKCK